MAILLAHHTFSIVYGMPNVSYQSLNYKHTAYSSYSASVHTVINYNPGINNAGYNIIEMIDHNPTHVDRTQISDPRDTAIITMQRHGTGNGLFPDYSLTVYGNGSVIYKGIKNVASSGVKTYQIPKDQSRQLVNEFLNIYYFSLKEKYSDSGKASNLPIVTTEHGVIVLINGDIVCTVERLLNEGTTRWLVLRMTLSS